MSDAAVVSLVCATAVCKTAACAKVTAIANSFFHDPHE
jgi:hypothetical protein